MAGRLVDKFRIDDVEIVVWHEYGQSLPYAVIEESVDGSHGVVLELFSTAQAAWKSARGHARLAMAELTRWSEEAAGSFVDER